MPPYAIETEALGRIYKIRGIKKSYPQGIGRPGGCQSKN